MAETMASGSFIENGLIRRLSLVARFDTVVFHPQDNLLQIWRYKTGRFMGQKEVVSAFSSVSWIRSKKEFKEVVELIGKISQLHVINEEDSVPEPWWGYRFI